MKTCKNCILNEKYPHFNLNKNGVCNYCNQYKKFDSQFKNYKSLNKLFNNRIESVKGKFDYDCLVGISGGKDSSYVLHMLKNHYKLNVLAYTFDNGYLTDYARENINNLIDKTGVDHFYHKLDWKMQKNIYKNALEIFGIPCKGCSIGAYGTSYKFAFEKNIPFVFHGRTPPQLFREFIPKSSDPTIPFIKNNIKKYDKEKQIETLLEVAEKMVLLIKGSDNTDEPFLQAIAKEFFPDIFDLVKSDNIPEFLGYFLYHEYDEENIKKVLEKELKWKRPDKDKTFTHEDCKIHDAVEYIRYKKDGYTYLEPEISVLIRQGKISKEKALKRVKQENALIKKPEKSLRILCDSLDLDYKKFVKKLDDPNAE